MGKNSEEFIQQRENFYSRLEEEEEYATVSMRMYMLERLKMNGGIEVDYTITEIKTKQKKNEN